MPPLINLLVQYHNHPLAARQVEYDYTLRRNLANPQVKHVHNLVEPHTEVPAEFRAHSKYVHQIHPRWLTYQDAFAYANGNLPGEIFCLANLDIFLDDSGTNWEQFAALPASVVLCLSRFEFSLDQPPYLDPVLARIAGANSQDAWLFKSPLNVPDCDFEIGTLGCDNAIAERIKRAGYFPFNAPQQFKIFHFDRCRGKTVANHAEHHAAERAGRSEKHPEESGQYLLPDADAIRSVDELLKALSASNWQRYSVICDIMSKFIKLRSRKLPESPP